MKDGKGEIPEQLVEKNSSSIRLLGSIYVYLNTWCIKGHVKRWTSVIIQRSDCPAPCRSVCVVAFLLRQKMVGISVEDAPLDVGHVRFVHRDKRRARPWQYNSTNDQGHFLGLNKGMRLAFFTRVKSHELPNASMLSGTPPGTNLWDQLFFEVFFPWVEILPPNPEPRNFTP